MLTDIIHFDEKLSYLFILKPIFLVPKQICGSIWSYPYALPYMQFQKHDYRVWKGEEGVDFDLL